MEVKNNNNQPTNSGQTGSVQQPSGNQGTSSWPSINTSTSDNMNRLQIRKSEEFEQLVKKHAKK